MRILGDIGSRLEDRIDALYLDKLDGQIDNEFLDCTVRRLPSGAIHRPRLVRLAFRWGCPHPVAQRAFGFGCLQQGDLPRLPTPGPRPPAAGLEAGQSFLPISPRTSVMSA